MNPEIKARWAAALRSGDYVQGTHHLRRYVDGEPRHCCLGVLCELALAEGVIARRPHAGDGELDAARADAYYDPADQPDFDYTGVLPPAVARWAGLRGSNPYVGDRSLSVLNDVGTPLAVIADSIERYL